MLVQTAAADQVGTAPGPWLVGPGRGMYRRNTESVEALRELSGRCQSTRGAEPEDRVRSMGRRRYVRVLGGGGGPGLVGGVQSQHSCKGRDQTRRARRIATNRSQSSQTGAVVARAIGRRFVETDTF